MNAAAPGDHTQGLLLDGAFALESGLVLPAVSIAYRTWGTLNRGADNAIVVCHALTGSADADTWWAPLFGPGRVLDPEHDFILCSNVLGGCYGTTGPTSLAPDRRLWGRRFPAVTIRDQAATTSKAARPKADRLNPKHVGAPMPGKVLKVNVMPGDKVRGGDVLFVTEAMKMETNVKLKTDATVIEVRVKEGDKVEKDDLVAVLA